MTGIGLSLALGAPPFLPAPDTGVRVIQADLLITATTIIAR